MPPTTPTVRDNQTLDYESLRAEAKAAAEASGETQAALAKRFEVTPSAMSQALNSTGGRYATLQRTIITELTGFEVGPGEQVVTFRVRRKATT